MQVIQQRRARARRSTEVCRTREATSPPKRISDLTLLSSSRKVGSPAPLCRCQQHGAIGGASCQAGQPGEAAPRGHSCVSVAACACVRARERVGARESISLTAWSAPPRSQLQAGLRKLPHPPRAHTLMRRSRLCPRPAPREIRSGRQTTSSVSTQPNASVRRVGCLGLARDTLSAFQGMHLDHSVALHAGEARAIFESCDPEGTGLVTRSVLRKALEVYGFGTEDVMAPSVP